MNSEKCSKKGALKSEGAAKGRDSVKRGKDFKSGGLLERRVAICTKDGNFFIEIVCTRMKNIFQLFFISTNFHFENVPSVNKFSYSVFIYDRTKSDIYCPYRLILYEHSFVTF